MCEVAEHELLKARTLSTTLKILRDPRRLASAASSPFVAIQPKVVWIVRDFQYFREGFVESSQQMRCYVGCAAFTKGSHSK